MKPKLLLAQLEFSVAGEPLDHLRRQIAPDATGDPYSALSRAAEAALDAIAAAERKALDQAALEAAVLAWAVTRQGAERTAGGTKRWKTKKPTQYQQKILDEAKRVQKANAGIGASLAATVAQRMQGRGFPTCTAAYVRRVLKAHRARRA